MSSRFYLVFTNPSKKELIYLFKTEGGGIYEWARKGGKWFYFGKRSPLFDINQSLEIKRSLANRITDGQMG